MVVIAKQQWILDYIISHAPKTVSFYFLDREHFHGPAPMFNPDVDISWKDNFHKIE